VTFKKKKRKITNSPLPLHSRDAFCRLLLCFLNEALSPTMSSLNTADNSDHGADNNDMSSPDVNMSDAKCIYDERFEKYLCLLPPDRRHNTLRLSESAAAADSDSDSHSESDASCKPRPGPVESKAADIASLLALMPDVFLQLPVEEQLEKFDIILERFLAMQKEAEQMEAYKKQRQEIIASYPRKHQHLYSVSKWQFHPLFEAVIKADTKEAVDKLVTTTIPNVYVFPLFQTEFCNQMVEEIDHFQQWCESNSIHIVRPNSMNRYGAILNDFGFEPVLQDFMQTHLSVLTKHLFPSEIGASLDSHHSFCVEYEMGKDEKLNFHVDDSEVTLNACLGTEFKGGDLYFGGVRCGLHQNTRPFPNEEYEFEHEVGAGLLHLGAHRHLARSITSGRRLNLIQWCRSSTYRTNCDTTQCPDWCGWHHQVCSHTTDSTMS
jgi:hypothetical protein